MEGRPKKFTDPDDLSKKIDAFFDDCDSKTQLITNDKGQTKFLFEPYTLSGLHLWLRCDDETFNSYENDHVFRPIIKQAKKRVENWVEKKSLTGDLNPTVSIFNLKNNFGWKDKTEVETTDVSKDKYEAWLKENEKTLKVIEGEVSSKYE